MNKSNKNQGTVQPTRRSEISQVVIRLKTHSTSYFLLQQHKKWGDWSLVGGHVEDDERNDWSAAGYREVEEELQPLKRAKDFFLLPLFERPLSWGPVQSQSADGCPTLYTAQFFSMIFIGDPVRTLDRLSPEGLCLFSESDVITMCQIGRASNIINILQDNLVIGLGNIPPVWGQPINLSNLSISVHEE